MKQKDESSKIPITQEQHQMTLDAIKMNDEFLENLTEVEPKDFKNIFDLFDKVKRNLILNKDDNDEFLDLCFVLEKSELDKLQSFNKKPSVIWWAWDSKFGTCWTFTLFVRRENSNKSISLESHILYSNDPLKGNLKLLKFRINLICDFKTLLSYEINANNLLAKDSFERCFETDENNEIWFEDTNLQKYFSLEHIRTTNQTAGYKTRIKIQYANSLSNLIHNLKVYFEKWTRKYVELEKKSPVSTEFFQIVDSFYEESQYPTIVNQLDKFFEKYSLRTLENDLFFKLKGIGEEDYDYFINKLHHCVSLYVLSPLKTNYGERFCWYSRKTDNFESTEIAYEDVINHVDGNLYWDSYFHDVTFTPHDYGVFLSGSDVPISQQKLINGLKQLKSEASPEELTDSFVSLLEDAVMNKKGFFIPPSSRVEINFGPFSAIEVNELGNAVHFTLRTETNNYCTALVIPAKKAITMSRLSEACSFHQDETLTKNGVQILCSVALLLACIIRDFWILEERESLFTKRSIRKRLGNTVNKEERIIYLPRTKYTNNPDYKKLESSLNYTSRRKHFVHAHQRKSDNPSEFQRYLAQKYGIALEEGYTFVRPHERGTHEQIVKYRSRSALQCLYNYVPAKNNSNYVDWFKFELDMKNLFKENYFEVEDSSASGAGDGGIDIIVRSKSETSKVWVVQCKCKLKKIGPDIIRELKGAIAFYKTTANGICITTSEFTSTAMEVAADPEFNFFLIDKYKLQEYLNKPLSLKQDLELFYS